MPVAVDDGGGGPTWNGSITVHPGNLEATSPDFSAAGEQVTLVLVTTTMVNSGAASCGITDPGAAAAWARLTSVWNKDLNDLSTGFQDLSGKLATSGAAYAANDQSVMPETVRGTVITQK
jgi:predicted secreted protein